MACAGRQGDNLVEQFPLNEQGDPNFHVGGVDRELPPEEQLEQLLSYVQATYEPSENYLALLPDRLTHASMLMLGSAVDHAMPGVAFTKDAAVSQCEWGPIFGAPSSHWCVSSFDGPEAGREHMWRPEVAGAANLSGVSILDLNSPENPENMARAIEYARAQGAEHVTAWVFGSAPLAPADSYILTFPTELPKLSAPHLIQVATKDEVAPRFEGELYHSTHYVSTPAEARRRVQDAAEFLKTLS